MPSDALVLFLAVSLVNGMTTIVIVWWWKISHLPPFDEQALTFMLAILMLVSGLFLGFSHPILMWIDTHEIGDVLKALAAYPAIQSVIAAVADRYVQRSIT